MPLSDVEKAICKAVVSQFIAENKPTTRRALLRQFKEAVPEALNRLVNFTVLKGVANATDAFLPTSLAFRWCGDADLLRFAKHSVEVVLGTLRTLFNHDLEQPEQPEHTPDDIGAQAKELKTPIEPQTIRIGLYLAGEFGVFATIRSDPEYTQIVALRIGEGILTIGDIEKVWDKHIEQWGQRLERESAKDIENSATQSEASSSSNEQDDAGVRPEATPKTGGTQPVAQPFVYLSYTPEDQAWHSRIRTHLANTGFTILDRLPTKSEDLMKSTLEKAHVFVLLVSSHYLASDEILKSELPQIRSLSQARSSRPIALILAPCQWQSFLGLREFSVIPEDGRTLAEGSPDQIGEDLDTLAREVRRALQETDKAEAPPQHGVPPIDLSRVEIAPNVIKLIPRDTAVRYKIMPVARVGSVLTIAMTDPTNVFAIDDIKFMTGFNVEPMVASESAIARAIRKFYGEEGLTPTDANQVRINELARELEVKAKTVIDLLPGYGVTEKKTHSSSIPTDVAEKVRKRIKGFAETQATSAWITQETFNRFSDEALDVLSRANRIRTNLDAPIIHTRHLLLAFREFAAGFAKVGSFTQLISFVTAHHKNLGEVLAPVPPIPKATAPLLTRPPAVSPNARNALLTAISKAGAAGPVEVSHVLFGVLSTVKNASVRELNALGMTPDAVPLSPVAVHAIEQEPVLAGYQSDDPSGADLLGISDEVRALASVLAAKDADPPLSLGLFGDWGTGKSFFMRKLEGEIKRLGDDAKEAKKQLVESAYCSNIVQIPFNAWNYIDSDLWASLTSEIFENLAAAIVKERGLDKTETGRPSDPEELAAQRELVLAAASTSEAILAEAERKKAAAEKELNQTEERLASLQRSEAAIENALTPGEILRQALGSAMQDEKMKEYVGEITQTLRIPETQAAASEVQSEILQLKNAGGTIYFTLKNEKRLWIWLAALGIALISGLVVTNLLTWLGIQTLANRVLGALTFASALLIPFVNTTRKVLAVVQAAKESKRQLIEQKKREQTLQLEKTREAVRQNVAAARNTIAETHERIKKLNERLDSMRADRRMADYIRERHQSTDYTQRLGIISRVRSDLRHLSTLLRDVRQEAEQEEFDKDMKNRQKEKEDKRKEQGKPELFPRIDRIVLYIDDLDRCPEKNVVEVLQAVHLLLAFPLFVVVVGVDPRWLLHSLRQHSQAFQNDELQNDESSPLAEERHWQSTPLNYLEKIFQIPYSLRPIEKKGFGEIVDKFARSSEAPGVEVPRPDKRDEPKTSRATTFDQQAGAALPGPETGYEASPLPGASVTPEQTQADVAATSPQPTASQHPSVPPVVDRNPAQLQIGDSERALMKELDEFIPTPRAGKRFINIYRLLRASIRTNELEAFTGNQHGGGYQAATLLLALLTGCPSQATEILRVLIDEEPSGNWWEFVSSFKDRKLGKSASSDASASTAKAAAERRANRASWVELFEKLDKVKHLVSDRSCEQFVEWAPRVARYSFQSGRVLSYQKR
jgi:hypothetical protein